MTHSRQIHAFCMLPLAIALTHLCPRDAHAEHLEVGTRASFDTQIPPGSFRDEPGVEPLTGNSISLGAGWYDTLKTLPWIEVGVELRFKRTTLKIPDSYQVALPTGTNARFPDITYTSALPGFRLGGVYKRAGLLGYVNSGLAWHRELEPKDKRRHRLLDAGVLLVARPFSWLSAGAYIERNFLFAPPTQNASSYYREWRSLGLAVSAMF